jgi:hypothetical protein
VENTNIVDIDMVLRTNPFLALDLENIEEIALKYLPYSVGLEFEVDNSNTFNEKDFLEIPDLIETDVKYGEKRFRVPTGIKGLCAIYNICEKLKTNCLLTESGIHCHVDFSDFPPINDGTNTYWNLITTNQNFIDQNKEFLLQELDKWEYKGSYNPRGISKSRTWIRMREGYKTFEFRIIEMTFDYEVLIRRVLHASLLSKLLKDKFLVFNEGVYINEMAEEETIKNTLANRIVNIYNQAEI